LRAALTFERAERLVSRGEQSDIRQQVRVGKRKRHRRRQVGATRQRGKKHTKETNGKKRNWERHDADEQQVRRYDRNGKYAMKTKRLENHNRITNRRAW